MTRDWRQLEGMTVAAAFPLRQYLGGSEESAVFLTERREREPQKAAIKLVTAGFDADAQLARWQAAARLAHPHLIPIFESGRCRLGSLNLLYVVMEYADENLGQILPHRPLTPQEARELLEPALDALAYIHGKAYVHGRLKPANIMAVRDQLKLSSDSLIAAGALARPVRPTIYDAPELAAGKISPASDAWSLGITLMEALTQRRPSCDGLAEPVLETVPTPFMGIAHCCLRRDPQRRCSAADIAARLRSNAPAPSLAQQPSTLRIPPEAARWRYVLLLAAVALAFAALVLGPRWLGSRGGQSTGPATRSAAPASPAVSTPAESQGMASRPKPSPAPRRSSTRIPGQETSPVAAAPSHGQTPIAPEPAAPLASSGAIVHQVVPAIPKSARETITGTIRVRVKVNVDASGNVESASLITPGPSQYFARQARQAAEQWKFAPNNPGSWILQFGFRQGGTTVTPERAH